MSLRFTCGKNYLGKWILTETPRLVCKYKVIYVINKNSREMHWALQENTLDKNLDYQAPESSMVKTNFIVLLINNLL